VIVQMARTIAQECQTSLACGVKLLAHQPRATALRCVTLVHTTFVTRVIGVYKIIAAARVRVKPVLVAANTEYGCSRDVQWGKVLYSIIMA